MEPVRQITQLHLLGLRVLPVLLICPSLRQNTAQRHYVIRYLVIYGEQRTSGSTYLRSYHSGPPDTVKRFTSVFLTKSVHQKFHHFRHSEAIIATDQVPSTPHKFYHWGRIQEDQEKISSDTLELIILTQSLALFSHRSFLAFRPNIRNISLCISEPVFV